MPKSFLYGFRLWERKVCFPFSKVIGTLTYTFLRHKSFKFGAIWSLSILYTTFDLFGDLTNYKLQCSFIISACGKSTFSIVMHASTNVLTILVIFIICFLGNSSPPPPYSLTMLNKKFGRSDIRLAPSEIWPLFNRIEQI